MTSGIHQIDLFVNELLEKISDEGEFRRFDVLDKFWCQSTYQENFGSEMSLGINLINNPISKNSVDI